VLSPPSSFFGGFSPVTRPGFFFADTVVKSVAEMGWKADMAQPLWYLRHDGKVYGPFPAPQIDTALAEGDINPDWEVSLNENDWLTIAESGQFAGTQTSQAATDPATNPPGWREERLRARQRWLGEAGMAESALPHDSDQDAQARKAITSDHAQTEALLQAQKHARASPLAALLGILLVLSIGLGIWWGEPEKPIQTKIDLVADCAAPATDGVNWMNCDKKGFTQPGMRARNAKLEQVRLDEARLGGADLTYAILRRASLRNAQLSGATLLGADLTGADLSGADLKGADLRYANLSKANLNGTRIESARLGRAVWVDGRTCAEGAPGACR
jgi:hypothetical protein